ncbi:hypothetical protein NQT62_02155 [Limnobacter humi]|uniref:Uncharacterized protein n=1 Tax=Limnobacter humi TaxID=1778671 RepID=A0ABT1WCK6_9BURK|nr:hypothetical protein [Limnobacter humi]MCQ8895240.1 hypothetical protein [Limnobacter humi]
MTRPDHRAEVSIRGNAAASMKAETVVFVGLSDETCSLFSRQIPASLSKRIDSVGEAEKLRGLVRATKGQSLSWGYDNLAYGLLTALRQQRSIHFVEKPSPSIPISSPSGHWVFCETGDDHAQVVAANYAHSLDAGLCLIPKIDKRQAEALLESFYSLYELHEPVAEALERLRHRLRELTGPLPSAGIRSATFITNSLPLGVAFPEFPSTHLMLYPQLGVSMLGGFVAEQDDKQGIGCAVLVDPKKAEAPEIEAAADELKSRRIFVRGYVGPAANVLDVSRMVELFPYDLLVIATHCGDAPGWRWTYEFADSSGKPRRLEVDTAIGVALSDRDDDKVLVTQLYNFVSLDGVSWHDPDRESKLVVGAAIVDFTARIDELEPVLKTPVDRVHGAAVLQMHDNNYLPIPREVAGHGSPVILNNACASWHRLSETFILGGARAYLGTLYPVTVYDAEPVTSGLLGKHFGKPLPVALWASQREAYGVNSPRRPYVMAGIFPQRLRTVFRDVPAESAKALLRTARQYKRLLSDEVGLSEKTKEDLKKSIEYLEREANGLYERWIAPSNVTNPPARLFRKN